ncbi:MAG: transposase [Candidatus Eisenbacteria bacterium]
MSKPRHTDEFKREAVAQVIEGRRRRTDVARSLGITTTALYNWIKEFEPDPSTPPAPAKPETELARLRREVVELREENRFLKKAAAYFAKERPRGTR